MSFLQDLYNGKLNGQSWSMPQVGATRTLPNGGGTYQAPTASTQTSGMFIGPQNQITPPVAVKTPVVSTPTSYTPSPSPVPVQTQQKNKYINPATGAYYTPEEYANSVALKLPTSKASGDVGLYAGNALVNPDQTKEQLNQTAYGMNNARNDIAVGQTNPYDITQGGKIVYSPQERAAIEKAYAGIYDPALSDVFSKLDTKAKEEASKLDQKNKLEQMAKQHEYTMAEKNATVTGSGSGTYTPGENAAVDAWAQGIIDGSRKITDIPSSQKGMRDLVQMAIVAGGNKPDGKPTTTELGLQTLDAAKRLMEMFTQRKGTQTVGASRLWAGGALQGAMPGTESFDFTNLYNTLTANKSLEGVKFLKGQGQVSDAERLLLKQAMSELNLSQGEDAFKNSLQSVIDKLEGGSSRILKSPDGTQQVNADELTPDELKEAQNAGWK